MKRNWLIVGASRGLGRVWAEAALERGDNVAATARRPEDLAALVARYGEAFLPLVLDVTDRNAVFETVSAVVARFGGIDVAIANAGYALFGTIEESSEDESRRQFETNFFGTLWVVQAVLPVMRRQCSGHVLATSSLAGVTTFPTAGIYNATKWAVEGLLQTLTSEVAAFGVKVTLIEPGGYATDWRGPSSARAAPMPQYDALRESLKNAASARTLGNPKATASAILDVVDTETPPLRLFLGAANLGIVRKEYAGRIATWEAWADTAVLAQDLGAPPTR